MKIREIITLAVGTVAVLVFTGFMFDYYLRAEEVQVIKRDMYFDSLILKEQMHLRVKDSLLEKHIQEEDERTRKILQYHNHQIKKIQDQLKNIENK